MATRGSFPKFGVIIIIFQILALTQLAEAGLFGNRKDVSKVRTKLGTIDQLHETWFYLVRSNYRQDKQFRDNLLATLQQQGIPPRRRSVFPMESSYLGLLGVQVEVSPGFKPKIPIRLKLGLKAYWKEFSDIDKDLSLYLVLEYNSYPPFWLHRPDDGRVPTIPSSSGTDSSESRDDPDSDGGSIGSDINPEDSDAESIEARSLDDEGRPSGPGQRNFLEKRVDDGDGTDWDIYTSHTRIEGFSYGQYGLSDLTSISDPPGTPIEPLPIWQSKVFWNYKNPGKGQFVYVLDGDCDPTHPELKNVKFGDWIYAGGFPKDERSVDTDPRHHRLKRAAAHGQHMVARIAGAITGVAQEAEVIFVENDGGRGEASKAAMRHLDSLLKTYDHIRSRGTDRNCVLTMAFGFDDRFFYGMSLANGLGGEKSDTLWRMYKKLFKFVLDEVVKLPNVIVTLAPGNDDDEDAPVEVIPAVFAVEGPRAAISKKLVLVGGYKELTGENYGPWPRTMKIWAAASVYTYPCVSTGIPQRRSAFPPARGLCLSGIGGLQAGTSVASATVAGVIATLMSAGMPRDLVIDYIYKRAYARKAGSPKALWNGITKERTVGLVPMSYGQALIRNSGFGVGP
ncbi:hypothetical protein TWF730_008993 [Orbilia blumenaviensis]|uniref:Peptidase S8/S53 domain-containing protein n=1 Tax=Orbilia blumenaviensis TaxID=1796055 RepID=A0AAV9UX27_9PEZI